MGGILILIAFLRVNFNEIAACSRRPVQSQSTDAAQIKEKITNVYGPGVVAAASDRQSFFWRGDFNGDAAEDLAVLVNIRRIQKDSRQNVTVLNPWGLAAKNNSDAPTLAIAIIHGAAGQSPPTTPPVLQAFLLTDRDFFSSPIWAEKSGDPLITLRKRSFAKGRRNSSLPRAARGDCLTVATEAGIALILYWDGKTYKLFTPQEEP